MRAESLTPLTVFDGAFDARDSEGFDALTRILGVYVVSTHPPFLVNSVKTAPDKEGEPLTDECQNSSKASKTATVAYIGWFVLAGAIRDAIKERGKVGDRLARGKEVTRKVDMGRRGIKRVKERVPLDKEERAAALAEYGELTAWLDRLQADRRQNAYLAGDLIPEIERAAASEPLVERDYGDDDE